MTTTVETAAKIARQAENELVGAMITSDEAVAMALSELELHHMVAAENRTIFSAIESLSDGGKPAGVVDIRREALEHGTSLDLRYITGLMERACPPGFYGQRVKILQERAALHEIRDTCSRIAQQAHESVPGSGSVEGFLDELSDVALTAGSQPESLSATDMKGALAEAFAEIEAAQKYDAPPGITTGLYKLDDKLGGLRPGEMIVIAGPTSSGKSLLALQMARVAASGRWDHLGGRRAHVLYCCTEMRRQDLAKRMLSAEGHIAINRIRDGRLDEEEMTKLREAIKTVTAMPITLDTQRGMTVRRLCRFARHRKRIGELDMVIVDLLTQVRPGIECDSREQQVAYVSAELTALAVELDVPLVAVAQTNRNAHQRSSKEPVLGDLRESAGIENDADIVIFLHRQEDWPGERLELHVKKNRNGECGKAEIARLFRTQRFDNREGDDGAVFE